MNPVLLAILAAAGIAWAATRDPSPSGMTPNRRGGKVRFEDEFRMTKRGVWARRDAPARDRYGFAKGERKRASKKEIRRRKRERAREFGSGRKGKRGHRPITVPYGGRKGGRRSKSSGPTYSLWFHSKDNGVALDHAGRWAENNGLTISSGGTDLRSGERDFSTRDRGSRDQGQRMLAKAKKALRGTGVRVSLKVSDGGRG